MDQGTILNKIKELINNQTLDQQIIFQETVDLLHDNFPAYTWVGIYLVKDNNLVLAVWNGPAATEHIRIPVGQGICGAAAASGQTEMVGDVSKDKRYLACFCSTKSEIVVPIKKGNTVVGEIDIDSDKPVAFTETDRAFLENIVSLLGGFETNPCGRPRK